MNLFKYHDYRPFLRDFIAGLPRRGRGELNRIATHIGAHPSLLSQVLSDTKQLSLEQAFSVCEYLGLSAKETEFFILLVEFQRAGTPKLKAFFKEKVAKLKIESEDLRNRVRQDQQLTAEEKSIFYSHWHYNAVWLFTSVRDGKDLEQICERFELSRERASSILNFLVETKLCDQRNGLYVMGAQSVHLELQSVHLPRHHTNWRLRSIEASDRISPEELMYTAPFSISKTDFKLLRSRMTEVISEFTNFAIKSDAEDVACFSLDLYWLD